MALKRKSKIVSILLTLTMLFMLWPGVAMAEEEDTTPPAWASGFPKGYNISDKEFDLGVWGDEDGTAYYVRLGDGSTAPSAEQVAAGQDASGTSLSSPEKGNVTVNATGGSVTRVKGLTPDTSYDVYTVLEDKAGNLQAEPTRVEVTTTFPDASKSGITQVDPGVPGYKKITVYVTVKNADGIGSRGYLAEDFNITVDDDAPTTFASDPPFSGFWASDSLQEPNNGLYYVVFTGDADNKEYTLTDLTVSGVVIDPGPCKIKTPPPALATPTGLTWDSTTPGKAKWDEVTNASSYEVQLYEGPSSQVGFPIKFISDTEYDFTSFITERGYGSYRFRVTAIGDGDNYGNSRMSEASPDYNYSDTAPAPTITDAIMATANEYITVTFSEGVYGDAAHTTAINKDDFDLTFAQNGGVVSGASINWLNTTGHLPLAGGETECIILLNLVDGPATGDETITISPKANSIYSSTGIAVPTTESTGELALNILPAQSFVESYPKQGAVQPSGSHAIQVLAKVALDGVINYVVLPDNATAPTAQQIKDHADIDGNPVISWAGAVISADTEVPITLTSNLSDNTAYDIYMVAQAGNNNFSAVKKLDVTTPPATATAVCKIGDISYATLDAALDKVQDGETITLLQSIDHYQPIVIAGKAVTFDLGSFNLNIDTSAISNSTGLTAENFGKVSCTGNGNLNVTAFSHGVSASEGSEIHISGNVIARKCGVTTFGSDKPKVTVDGDVTVTGVGASGEVEAISAGGYATVTIGGHVRAYRETEAYAQIVTAIYANGSTITVGKDVTTKGSGVNVQNDGKVTIEGALNFDPTGTGSQSYIKLGYPNVIKTADDFEETSTKPGYKEYRNGDNIVWVKGAVQLDTPTGLTWDSTIPGKAKWDAVPNAEKYYAYLYKDDETSWRLRTLETTNERNFNSNFETNGTGAYRFKVEAIGDGINYGNSPMSAASEPYNYIATATGVTLDNSTLSLTVGGTETLVATVAPADATNKNVTWSSNDEAVATVVDGVVTAVAAGNATITVTTVDGSFTSTCEVTVTAAPGTTYTVTYDLNGGSGTAPTETAKAADANFTAADATGLTAPGGQQFASWNTAADGSGTTYLAGETVTMPAADLTLYAIWEAIPATTYTVTISGGGSGASGAGEYAAGDSVNINAGNRSGYTFKGWTSDDDVTITNASSKNASFTMPANNVTVTANWKRTSSGGGVVTPTVTGVAIKDAPDKVAYTEGDELDLSGLKMTLTYSNGTTKDIALADIADNKITVSPKAGDVLDAADTEIVITVNGKTVKQAITVEKDSTVTPPVKEPILTDIDGHWAQANIEYLVGIGAISGYPDETFRPDALITRAEFAKTIVDAFELTAGSGKIFTDTADHWAKDYVAIAAANGIVLGYNEDEFGPDDLIIREQMAIMIIKAAGLTAKAGELDFIDKADISSWAYDWAVSATQNEIMSGYTDKSFKPLSNATRAEAATVIYNVLMK